MAIVTSGPYLGFSGTVDGITYYPLPDGRTCAKRKNKKRTVPAKPKQLVVETDTKVFANFMKPLKRFTTVGYGLEGKKLGMNSYNAMVSCNRRNSIQGEFPNRSVDCAKILMTKGSLPGTAAAEVKVTETGLAFNWDTKASSPAHISDQAILMAYFPELKESRYTTGGAKRLTGKDVLDLAGIRKGSTVEVYISFVSDDRSQISDSLYLGKFSW
ncbi:DUF6266 family protein [Pedobacter sp. AW31-3R]|uniref:DUF6266 family protein n=1 Tax=Pedobacter sp. AW31-3R TaxID=3445781 RepID=UPI003FA01F72